MKKSRPISILILCLCFPLNAQNFLLSGTMEGEAAVNVTNGDSPYAAGITGDYAIENTLLLNAGVRLFDTGNAFGYINADLLLYGLLDGHDELTESATATVNEAYLNVPLADWLILVCGKKRIVSGVGLSCNPSDFINPPKDPLDPLSEKRGVYCLNATMFIDWFSLSQTVVLNQALDRFGFGTRLSFSGAVPGMDLNLTFFYSSNDLFNLGASLDATPFDRVPVLSNLALHAETGFRQVSDTAVFNDLSGLPEARGTRFDFYKDALAGLRFTIPGWGTMLAAEYYHIDDGYEPSELRALEDAAAMTSIAYVPGRMCRDNLMLSLIQPTLTQKGTPFTDTLGISATLLLNLADGSFLVSGKIESSVITNCVIGLNVSWFGGPARSEYRLSPYDFSAGFRISVGF
jgi:hypothetical protein